MSDSKQEESFTKVIIEGEDGEMCYLHLPVRKEYLLELIDNCISMAKSIDPAAGCTGMPKYEDYVFVRKDCGYKKVKVKDVVNMEAQRNYCNLHLTDGRSLTVSMPMNEVYEYFNPSHFKRIHRSFIVNQEHVDTYIGNMLVMDDKRQIPIGREYRETVRAEFVCIGSRKRVREKNGPSGG